MLLVGGEGIPPAANGKRKGIGEKVPEAKLLNGANGGGTDQPVIVRDNAILMPCPY
jgi:hypothetical protein